MRKQLHKIVDDDPNARVLVLVGYLHLEQENKMDPQATDGANLFARKGLVHDQRRVLVSLTARSRSLAARMAPHIEDAYVDMEKALGPDFVERCYAMLDHIGVALAPRPGESDDE